ncbi:MAG: hypothetical protein R3B48_16930 [Kofleriaceae bacterium]
MSIWLRIATITRAGLARISERAILATGWFVLMVYAFPGYMSYDSVWQLVQARGVEPLSDWHPPLMAFMWRLLDRVIAGPILMLVLQSVLFLLGLHALLRRFMPPRAAALVASLVLIAPQNIVVMGVIWKDSQMAAFLLAAIPALLSEHRRYRVLGYVALVIATGLRYNAAAATLPLLVLLAAYHQPMKWWRRALLGSGLWVVVTLCALLVSYLLVEKRLHPWQTGAAPVDIAGIIRYSRPIPDAELLRATPGVPWTSTEGIQKKTRAAYTPANSFFSVVTGDHRVMEYPSTDEHFAAISNAWKTLVLSHPWPFVFHRLQVFKTVLNGATGGERNTWVGFVAGETAEASLGHRASHSRWQQRLIDLVLKADALFGVRVRFYFALSLVLIWFCLRRKVIAAILLSGLAYQLGLLAVVPAIDYRYTHWMVVCTMIGTICLVAARRRDDPRRLAAAVAQSPTA